MNNCDGKDNVFAAYWEEAIPWNFKGERIGYDERRRLRYDLQDYMADTIPFAAYRGKRVLEVGSGSGVDSAEFGRNGAEVTSLDFTETGVRGTQKTLKEAGLVANVVRAAAQSLPFVEGAFDCVYSFGVLHHILDIERPVSEIEKVLRPGGEFICMLYHKNSLLYAYSILFLHRREGLSEDDLVSRYSERIEGCPYTRAFTKEEVRSLLAEGFLELSIAVHFNVIDTPTKRKVKVGVADGSELGWHIIARARKPGP